MKIGYKALHIDYTSYNNFKYEIGKTYELPEGEKLEICKCGFHFCANPIDVFRYYEDDGDAIIVEVEVLGNIVGQGIKYATDKIKILRVYTRKELNSLIVDTKYNTGKYNTGKYNSGNYNTGNFNSGCHNTSNDNRGYGNSGNGNSGNYNTGDFNSGSYNSGSYNGGNHNTGDFNSGNSNTGHYNTGYYNNGYFNSGNYNTGMFNTKKHKMTCFDKECDVSFKDFVNSLDYNFYALCERIYNKKLIEGDREKIEALPNYDPSIFTEITGIKFD